jgi:hypothetical protein
MTTLWLARRSRTRLGMLARSEAEPRERLSSGPGWRDRRVQPFHLSPPDQGITTVAGGVAGPVPQVFLAATLTV